MISSRCQCYLDVEISTSRYVFNYVCATAHGKVRFCILNCLCWECVISEKVNLFPHLKEKNIPWSARFSVAAHACVILCIAMKDCKVCQKNPDLCPKGAPDDFCLASILLLLLFPAFCARTIFFAWSLIIFVVCMRCRCMIYHRIATSLKKCFITLFTTSYPNCNCGWWCCLMAPKSLLQIAMSSTLYSAVAKLVFCKTL